jgi:hypothetical protein
MIDQSHALAYIWDWARQWCQPNGIEIMVNHSRRNAVAAARKAAQAAGYYIREGSYHGTTDDRLGRWYVGHQADNFFRPLGAGHATQGDAWLSIADDMARG